MDDSPLMKRIAFSAAAIVVGLPFLIAAWDGNLPMLLTMIGYIVAVPLVVLFYFLLCGVAPFLLIWGLVGWAYHAEWKQRCEQDLEAVGKH